MGNHKGGVWKRRHRGLFCPFPTRIPTFFHPPGLVMGAVHHHRPEALLAGMDTALAEAVVLPPAVRPQEEGPLQPPLHAPAHSSPSSGGFFSGAGFACCFAHSRFAASNRSRMEGFFSGCVRSACSLAFSSSSPRLPLLSTPSIMP